MGRGLSPLQRRILALAERDGGWVGWLDGTYWRAKPELRAAILPDRPTEWTASDRAVVSRSLARLVQRGLIRRQRGQKGRRTMAIRRTEPSTN
jgi:hypothetical protein